MDFKLIISRNVLFGACPKCKEIMTLERVKTKSKFEKIFLTILRKKKYHCKSCKWYGTLFIYTLSKKYKKIIFNYLILFVLIIVGSVLASILVRYLLNPK